VRGSAAWRRPRRVGSAGADRDSARVMAVQGNVPRARAGLQCRATAGAR
jgi:hypothetical protein